MVFVIFTFVRKYNVAIFLCILFTLAFVNAGSIAIQETDTLSSLIPKANSYLITDYNTANSEIEISSNLGFSTPQAHQVFQKLLGNLSPDTKKTYSPFNFSSLKSSSPNHFRKLKRNGCIFTP
jgi:hypothetical protein